LSSGVRIEKVLPVLCALEKQAMLFLVAKTPRQFREREIGRSVLECFGGAAPGIGNRGNVMETQPLVERGTLANACNSAPGIAEIVRRGHGGCLQQRGVGGLHVELVATEGQDAGHGGSGGI